MLIHKGVHGGPFYCTPDRSWLSDVRVQADISKKDFDERDTGDRLIVPDLLRLGLYYKMLNLPEFTGRV